MMEEAGVSCADEAVLTPLYEFEEFLTKKEHEDDRQKKDRQKKDPQKKDPQKSDTVRHVLLDVIDIDEDDIKSKIIQEVDSTGPTVKYKKQIITEENINFHFVENTAVESKSGGKPFVCSECNRGFYYACHLKKHRDIHSNLIYKCNLCPKTYSSIFGLREHLLMHENKFSYRCDVCQKRFNKPSSLRIHEQIHISKTFECDICKKSLLSSHSLLRHKRTHNFHECHVCQEKFILSSQFNAHKRIHHGEKQFKCAHCNDRFYKSSELNIHLRRVHSNEKRYECNVCLKAFNKRRSLKMHKAVHSGEMYLLENI